MASAARILLTILLAAALGGCAGHRPAPSGPVDGSRQLLLVTAETWSSTSGELRRFERAAPEGRWTAVGRPIAVNLGRGGLGWGLGLHGQIPGPGPLKREGDGRAPAGLFALGTGFAYDPAEVGTVRLPLLRADENLLCVDGAESRYYNRIIDRRDVPAPDWSSVEEMRRKDGQYRLGALVRHNMDPAAPGQGSCIFLHIWRGPGLPTSGCTSMDPAHMLELLRWLDASKAPLMAQLPVGEYARLRAAWGLPD